MSAAENPKLLARTAGVFYVIIHVCALFAYLYIRGQLVVPGDMAQTATNLLANEQHYRVASAATLIVVMCNLPMGFLLYELLRVVNRRVALLALMFIIASATLEAVNLINHFQPLFTLNLPEVATAFSPEQQQAIARLPITLWGYTFSISLSFFGVFCELIGYLLFKSKFFPPFLGVLMALSGLAYLVNSFGLFLALPEVPHMFKVPLIAETSFLLWLLIFGVNEAKWKEQARVFAGSRAV